MAFEAPHERYASFGIVTSLPSPVIDTFWSIIDAYLMGVFPLEQVLQFELLNHKGKLAVRFSPKNSKIKILIDTTIHFDPFFPRRVLVLDKGGRQTVLFPDELSLF